MYYIKLTSSDIDFGRSSITEIYVELNTEGRSVREIGYDVHNNVIHKFPSESYKDSKYGLFDLAPFDMGNMTSDIALEDFERMWNN
ncbi:MAG TPA: hypothetical protein VKB19_15135 [Pedobacter sp.]|nr:hypothetical protein [Pedobacter sp.]